MRLVARAVGCHDLVLMAECCDDCFGGCSGGLDADFGCTGVLLVVDCCRCFAECKVSELS